MAPLNAWLIGTYPDHSLGWLTFVQRMDNKRRIPQNPRELFCECDDSRGVAVELVYKCLRWLSVHHARQGAVGF